MFQPRSIQSSLSFRDKLFSLDYVLIVSILILGIISMFAMYSTDGGQFARRWRSTSTPGGGKSQTPKESKAIGFETVQQQVKIFSEVYGQLIEKVEEIDFGESNWIDELHATFDMI